MKEPVFFQFNTKMVTSTFQVGAISLKKNINGENETWNLIKGKYIGIDFPVIFKQASGKKMTDFLDTGWPSLHIISDRMKQILEENHLTGWKTFPIKIYDKKGNEVLGYNGFSIIGHCAPIDYTKSEIIEKKRVPTGSLCKYYKGENINIDLWDKSDFFMPDDVYSIFVTEKVETILKINKITNIELRNAKDVEININNIRTS